MYFRVSYVALFPSESGGRPVGGPDPRRRTVAFSLIDCGNSPSRAVPVYRQWGSASDGRDVLSGAFARSCPPPSGFNSGDAVNTERGRPPEGDPPQVPTAVEGVRVEECLCDL
jgi:hypothetical protein